MEGRDLAVSLAGARIAIGVVSLSAPGFVGRTMTGRDGSEGGQLVAFQEMGFGIAIALALDATLVRLLLIPAAMRLLGERNWYLPSWLSWLPDLQVEGHQPPVAPADQPAHDDTAPEVPPGAVPVGS